MITSSNYLRLVGRIYKYCRAPLAVAALHEKAFLLLMGWGSINPKDTASSLKKEVSLDEIADSPFVDVVLNRRISTHVVTKICNFMFCMK